MVGWGSGAIRVEANLRFGGRFGRPVHTNVLSLTSYDRARNLESCFCSLQELVALIGEDPTLVNLPIRER